MWWRCLHSKCRGVQVSPHFCLLVLAAACCVAACCHMLVLLLAAAGRYCCLHDFCPSCRCCRCCKCFFSNRRIQYLAFFRLRLCACGKVFNYCTRYSISISPTEILDKRKRYAQTPYCLNLLLNTTATAYPIVEQLIKAIGIDRDHMPILR